MIKVALANPISPLATNVYMILVCVSVVPLLVILTLNGLILGSIAILLVLYLLLISIYALYASIRTKKYAVTLPFMLTLDCVIRFAGTFFGLVKMLVNSFKRKLCLKNIPFAT
jgi:mannose/fructose/N-acetylgalactosamine-specific phosphotransferase system component IID